MADERRVVITGVGLLSAVGVGREATWQALLQQPLQPVTY